MSEQRFVVSDALWLRLEPHLPGKVSDARGHGKGQCPTLLRGDEGYRQFRRAGSWPLDKKSGGKFAPAIPTTRTNHAAVSQYAKFAEIRHRSCLGL